MGLPNLVQGLGSFSRMKLSIDGNEIENMRDINFPDIMFKTIEVDNTSTGGKVEIFDPASVDISGEGEVMVEGYSFLAEQLMSDPTVIRNLVVSTTVNFHTPLLNKIIPAAVTFSCQAQFGNFNPGAMVQASKIENAKRFKMLSFNMKVNQIPVINFDFLKGVFELTSTDLLLGIQQILG